MRHGLSPAVGAAEPGQPLLKKSAAVLWVMDVEAYGDGKETAAPGLGSATDVFVRLPSACLPLLLPAKVSCW